MSDDAQCTDLGCMTPAQVVQCAEGSNKECWISAKVTNDDGTEVAYECCGGGGSKARFRLFKQGVPVSDVAVSQVPSDLTWVRRMTI